MGCTWLRMGGVTQRARGAGRLCGGVPDIIQGRAGEARGGHPGQVRSRCRLQSACSKPYMGTQKPYRKAEEGCLDIRATMPYCPRSCQGRCSPERTRPVTQPAMRPPACSAASARAAPARAGRATPPGPPVSTSTGCPLDRVSSKRGVPAPPRTAHPHACLAGDLHAAVLL